MKHCVLNKHSALQKYDEHTTDIECNVTMHTIFAKAKLSKIIIVNVIGIILL